MSVRSADLKPFFCFYGGKWRAAPHYPTPLHDTIIEPFAGAAGYATRHAGHKVVLYDADPRIAGLWQYLIGAKGSEIRSLPAVVESVNDIRGPQEARDLVGFWLNKGTAAPSKTPGAWMRSGIHPTSFWGSEIRARIAAQVEEIRHWKAYCKSWESATRQTATWFVDPPYEKMGKHYKYSTVDYVALAQWCRRLSGQVLVCEAAGASWLPFKPFRSIKASPAKFGGKVSQEVIWHS